MKYTLMFLMNMVKGLNYKLGFKVGMVMAGVGGDIVFEIAEVLVRVSKVDSILELVIVWVDILAGLLVWCY